jgi:prolyl oligopeptidase
MKIKSLYPRFVAAGAVALSLVFFTGGCGADSSSPPIAKMQPVTNTYHGVDVVDNYQWLENVSDTAVQAWTEGQDTYTRQILDGIQCRGQVAERLRELYDHASPSYYSFQWVGEQLFAIKKQPPLDQPILVVMASPHDNSSERIVVNPNEIDTTGKTSIDFFVVSPDAHLVAVSMSWGGTEDGDVFVFRVDNGERMSDEVPGVNGPTAGGDVAWLPDASGFFYTRYPQEGERPAEELRFYQQVYFHALGTPASEDYYVIGEEFPKIAEIEFETSPDNRYVLAVVSNGDGGEYDHFLKSPSGQWRRVTRFEDLVTRAGFGPDNSLYLLSRLDAPKGKILRLPEGDSQLARARMVVPESERVITGFVATTNHIYVDDILGGPSGLRVFSKSGTFQRNVAIPDVSAVRGLTAMDGDKVLFRISTYLEPTAAYTYEPVEGSLTKTALVGSSVADFSNVEVVRQFAQSDDGTQVPMTIIRKKGATADGNTPAILYGYGGYGSSQKPYYNETLSMWLNSGGIYVIANIRGGGEFGEEWHLQGNLTNKQNVFDDFAACAQHLIDAGYTNPGRLAIRGGSNGGLLVGAVMVQHPELFKAVVCQKGVLEMLRVELDPNGAFNVTEFGTVTNPDHFRALYAYSPYHNVKEGQAYPDVLFTADENDGRVSSANSKKMVARMQAAAAPGSLTLLRMSTGAGHGIGSSMSDRIAQDADVWSFLFDRLGVDYVSDGVASTEEETPDPT